MPVLKVSVFLGKDFSFKEVGVGVGVGN